jgi:hypothetical protein
MGHLLFFTHYTLEFLKVQEGKNEENRLSIDWANVFAYLKKSYKKKQEISCLF